MSVSHIVLVDALFNFIFIVFESILLSKLTSKIIIKEAKELKLLDDEKKRTLKGKIISKKDKICIRNKNNFKRERF